MNLSLRLTSTPHITLRDLAKPTLTKVEKAAIQRALKSARKDQEKVLRRAKSL